MWFRSKKTPDRAFLDQGYILRSQTNTGIVLEFNGKPWTKEEFWENIGENGYDGFFTGTIGTLRSTPGWFFLDFSPDGGKLNRLESRNAFTRNLLRETCGVILENKKPSRLVGFDAVIMYSAYRRYGA